MAESQDHPLKPTEEGDTDDEPGANQDCTTTDRQGNGRQVMVEKEVDKGTNADEKKTDSIAECQDDGDTDGDTGAKKDCTTTGRQGNEDTHANEKKTGSMAECQDDPPKPPQDEDTDYDKGAKQDCTTAGRQGNGGQVIPEKEDNEGSIAELDHLLKPTDDGDTDGDTGAKKDRTTTGRQGNGRQVIAEKEDDEGSMAECQYYPPKPPQDGDTDDDKGADRDCSNAGRSENGRQLIAGKEDNEDSMAGCQDHLPEPTEEGDGDTGANQDCSTAGRQGNGRQVIAEKEDDTDTNADEEKLCDPLNGDLKGNENSADNDQSASSLPMKKSVNDNQRATNEENEDFHIIQPKNSGNVESGNHGERDSEREKGDPVENERNVVIETENIHSHPPTSQLLTKARKLSDLCLS